MTKRVCLTISCSAGACLAVATLTWLSLAASKAGEAQPKVAPPAVETVKPVREDFKRVADSGVTVRPFETVALQARIPGVVKAIRVDLGDRVKKGEVLAELDVPEIALELKQKEALVAQAEAGIRQAKGVIKVGEVEISIADAAVKAAEAGKILAEADLDSRLIVHRKSQELAKQAAITAAELDISQQAVRKAEIGVKAAQAKAESAQAAVKMQRAALEKVQEDFGAAEARLLVAKAELEKQATVLGFAKIFAPFDGAIASRNVDVGAFVTPTAGAVPLFTLVNIDRLRIEAFVDEPEAPFLNKGSPVVYRFSFLPDKEFPSKITRIAPVLDSHGRLRLETELSNPEGKIRPGMSGHMTAVLEVKPKALTVPRDCVNQDRKGTYVWLVVGGKAQRRSVRVGITDRTKAEITAGLDGTEEVIFKPDVNLRDGQPVKAKPRDDQKED